jgi:16S rRNA U516 pseudouridylate synthase RsuA-like enzyme
LIFLTNDGDIVNKILRAGNQHEKEYLVVTSEPISAAFIEKMGNGVRILDTVTKKMFCEAGGQEQVQDHSHTGLEQADQENVPGAGQHGGLAQAGKDHEYQAIRPANR